jgi:FkbM family methyltransferase
MIRRLLIKLRGTSSHLKINIKCNHLWYGNTYGGFFLCPELLNKNSIIYSFGIGEDMSFDNAISMNHNCHVFCFDPTPKSIEWFKGLKPSEKYSFFSYGISGKDGFVDFYLPKNLKHVSGSIEIQKNIDIGNKVIVEMKSLGNIVKELGHGHIDVLKMDIEGSEYDVIADILNAKISITQILIEFHDRFFENGYLKSKQVVEMLKLSGYEIFAISDSFQEVSFIKADAISDTV